jgi:uncharacterized membrane protein
LEGFIANFEYVFMVIVQLCITLLESCGVLVLVITTAKALISFFRKEKHTRLMLAQGIALGLEFKLGGEVLRTTMVRDWSELGILGAIILLRSLMTLLILWEIKSEEARCG